MASNSQPRRNGRDLTSGPVWQRLLQLAMPMVLGIVAVISISLVDTYFVGKLGTDPLAALSFTFPVTLTIASLAIGLGAGAASVVSRAIGGGEDRQARRSSTDSLLLAVVVVAMVSALGYFTIRPLFSLLGASGEVLSLIERYMRIWYVSMPFLVIPMVANAIIRAAGDAFWPSVIMIGAAVVNIGITPLLIFGAGPVPALGFEGAAYGTLIARAATLIFSGVIIVFREHMVSFHWPGWQELLASWRRVAGIGLPAAAGNMVNPISVGIVTALLAGFGDVAVAAFGVATRIETFAAIPMLALSSAIGPVVGQNFGADRGDRVLSAVRFSYAVCFGYSLVIAAVLWFAGPVLATIFASEPAVAQEAAAYLCVVPLSLWGYGVVIVGAAAFNALGRSLYGLAYYLVRSALFYVPASWVAAALAGTFEVFVAIAVSNALAGVGVGAYTLRWLAQEKSSAVGVEEPATS